MGTRHEDQPAEHWAGPESLDPTPVWKQYVLIAGLLFGGLIAVLVVSLLAIAPQIVTPPALVPGDRLVLPRTEIPNLGAPPKRVGAPLVDDERALWLAQPERGKVLAFRTRWAPDVGTPACRIENRGTGAVTYLAVCGVEGQTKTLTFDPFGLPTGTSPRALDQYLVSVSDDRVIVNLSRVIEASERTGGPVPTGIPQPQEP